MVIVTNTVRLPAAKAEGFAQAFKSQGGRMQDVPGCKGFELWKKEGAGKEPAGPGPEMAEFVVMTRWESEEAFRNWTNSPAFAHSHRDTSSSEGGQAELGIYQVLIP